MVAPFLESEQLGSQIRPSDTDVETGQPRMNAPTRYKYLCSYVAAQPTTTVKQPDTGASLPVCEAIEPMSGIHQATPAEIRQLAVTGWRAFHADPVMRWFFPDDDDYLANGLGVFRWVIGRGVALNSTWCTSDGVAFAKWTPPGRPEAEVEDEPRNDPAWRLSRFMAYGTFSEANTPSEPHWYLNMLATHPDWQRTGFGAALMGEVFAIADAEGLGCYLETETEENVAYYRRHGFKVRTEWDLMTDDENDRSQGPHQWGMWRQPR